MPTLYRKYRPQTFADLIGQEHITQTITNAISLNKVAHAYLFSGPRGVGKTTLARLVAKAVNCPNRAPGTAEPCNTCSSCDEITHGRNIDVIEIDAASHTGVDNVRENIIENAQFKPTKSPFKVFVIDEVHMLSTSAFNALLKTLEEPPAHVIFVLATTENHKLPATILSRCQRFNFNKIPTDKMIKRLKLLAEGEEVEVEDEVLKRVAFKSDGCLRDAESLLGQIFSLGLKKITAADSENILPTPQPEKVLALLETVFNHNAQVGLEIIAEQIKSGANLEQFAYDIAETLRLVLILQTGFEPEELLDYKAEDKKRLKHLSTLITTDKLIKLTDKIIVRKQEMKRSTLPQLPLELWIIEATNLESQTKNTDNDETPKTPGGHISIIEEKTKPVTTEPVATIDSTPPAHKITETIKTAISNLTHPHKLPQVTIETIKEKWSDLIKELDQTNHSLTFILKVCTLEAITENGLEISLPYSFHKEKIEDRKTKRIIEDILEKILGERITIYCTVKEIQREVPVDETGAIAADFGGEVVE